MAATYCPLILLLPLLGFLSGIALLVFYRPLWFSIVLSLLAFAVAFAFHPRAAQLPQHVHLVQRDQAPVLYAVLDEIAAAVGARKVSAVAVSAEANLWYQQIGWRFQPVIGIGLPLSAGLRPQERIAILAHADGRDTPTDVPAYPTAPHQARDDRTGCAGNRPEPCDRPRARTGRSEGAG